MNSIFADLIAQGKVAVYLGDILIYSTNLEEHHQTTHEVLKQLQENDLYLRPEKCEFDQEQVEYLGMVIREGVVSFANFYQQFIKDFSKITRPLDDLTKKDCHWEWGMQQHQAFETLKEAFTKKPILVMWDPAWPTQLEVDASSYATGGVILQQLEDRLWHPGDAHHYTSPGRLSTGGQLKTCPDNKHNGPYGSRDSTSVIDAEDNQGQVVLCPERFMRIAMTRMKGGELEERIGKGVEKEAEVLQAVEELKKKGSRRLINRLLEWEEDNGLVYYKGKLYIPTDKGLHAEVLKQCHNAPTAGHLGEHGTLEQVSRYYWWPGMSSFVRKYVQGCKRCQRSKPAVHPDATLHPHDVPEGPWNVVGVDLITGLPESQGYDAIITYIDLYSKQTYTIMEIFRLYGIPHKFVSDRGPQFAAQVTWALYKHLGIQAGLTTAYHPSANRQTERANQEIEQFLCLFVSKRQDDWVDWLPTAEFVLNSQVHTAHDKSLFKVFPALEACLEDLKKIREEAEAALRMGKEKMKEAYEEGKRKAHEFKVGDKVWLAAKDIKIHQASRKLGPRQLGPFEMVEHIGDLDYHLKLPLAMKVHNVFYVNRLSPWKGNEVNGQWAPPPEAVEVEGEEEHLVEEILDS
uniref:Putative reverse transcriptase-rnase h-integrase n=1 Tax=Moniliophthora roreri TaxID=221103 RepID=A0A0W0F4X9_MONRR